MNPFILLAAAIAAVAFTQKGKKSGTTDMRKKLKDYFLSGGDSSATKERIVTLLATTMTDSEVKAVYEFIFTYIENGKKPQSGTALSKQLDVISKKYNIFN